MGAFGEKLRKQREQRGIELDAISNTTKISTRMLRAIEDEHFDQLPGGVFNKGFVRAYARQIGLDEDEAVADYLAALRENQLPQPTLQLDSRSPAAKPASIASPEPDGNSRSSIEVADTNRNKDNDAAHTQAPELPPEDRRKQGRRYEDRRDQGLDKDRRYEDRRRPRKSLKYPAGDAPLPADDSSPQVPWGKLALTLVLVTLVLALWNLHRQAQSAPASQPVPFSLQSPAPALAPASPAIEPSGSASSPQVASQPVASQPVASTPVAAAAPAATSPEKPPPAPISAATPPPPTKPAPTTASPTTPLAQSATKPAPKPDDNPPAVRSAVPTAAAKPPSPFTLLIRAEKTTWVSLTADGNPVAHETLIAPAHISVRASHEIIVKTGNAAGVSFLLNGKEIPPQGNEGEVKTYIFDGAGLRTAPQ